MTTRKLIDPVSSQEDDETLAASDVLAALLEGNRRFASGNPHYPNQDLARRVEALMLHVPIATVLSCSDSRVPVELVFDQGIGDLFVLRSAGCAVDTAVLGGLEFAVQYLHCPLILVLGHSKCGAVNAALHDDPVSKNLDTLLNMLRPAIRNMPPEPEGTRWLRAVHATVSGQKEEILARSQLLAERVAAGTVQVVGACYQLETGLVDVLP